MSLTVKTAGAVGATDGELFTVIIGQLAIQVFMLNLDVPRTVSYGLMNGDPVQIWPNPKGPIQWPPPHRLDDDGIEALFLRFTPDQEFPFPRLKEQRRDRE